MLFEVQVSDELFLAVSPIIIYLIFHNVIEVYVYFYFHLPTIRYLYHLERFTRNRAEKSTTSVMRTVPQTFYKKNSAAEY